MDLRSKAELYLLLVTFLWGLGFPIMKIGLTYISTGFLLTLTYSIGGLLVLISYRGRCLQRETLFPGILLGMMVFVAQGLHTLGLNYTTASNSAFITSLALVFAPFFGWIILREKLEKSYPPLLLMALAGLYLLITPAGIGQLNYGDILTVFCAIIFGVEIVFIQRYTSRDLDIVSLLFWQLSIGAGLYFFSSVVLGRETLTLHPIGIFSVVYLGIVATFITSILQFQYQRRTTIQRVSIIYAVEPIFAHLTAMAILGEKLSIAGYLGATLIVGAIIIQEILLGKSRRKIRHPREG